MRRPPTRPGVIDWAAVRRRLEESARALDAAQRSSPERDRALLEERARLLAQPPQREEDGARVQLLVLPLGVERYALEMRWVLEIVRSPEVTPVPAAPPFVLGVTAWRGESLAVFDLRRLLDAPAGAASEATRLVVLGDERAEFGLLAGSDLDERSVPRREIQPLSASLQVEGREHLQGILADATVVVDGGTLLADPRFFVEEDGHEPRV